MIYFMITNTVSCRDCNSTNIVKCGYNRNGNKRYKCKDCGKSKVITLKPIYTEERKNEILKAYLERPSLRGLSRIYGVSVTTLLVWLKKKDQQKATS